MWKINAKKKKGWILLNYTRIHRLLIIYFLFLKQIASTFFDWRFSGLSDFSDETEKSIFDVVSGLCGSFKEVDSLLFSKRLSFLRRNLSFIFQIAFVSNKSDRDDVMITFDSFHLIQKGGDLFEWNSADDRIDENKSFRISDPLISQCSEFFLSCFDIVGVKIFEKFFFFFFYPAVSRISNLHATPSMTVCLV